MNKLKLFLDTNIVVDYLNERAPHYEGARVIMIAGFAGEFELWISASQITDLIYILSDGEKAALVPKALEQLRAVREFINVRAVTDADIDKILQTNWKDPEDALLYECALGLRCDAIITRDKLGIESNLIPVHNCEEFLEYVSQAYKLNYSVLDEF